ncbi:MAG: hypothetical protein ACK59A_06310 [Cyanobacteriota bacterium]
MIAPSLAWLAGFGGTAPAFPAGTTTTAFAACFAALLCNPSATSSA